MGRGKVVLKPIDDKSLREVTFRNRSRGLLKKANELAVLCDVEIGVFVFSSTGKFYPFSSVGRSTSFFFLYIYMISLDLFVFLYVKKTGIHPYGNIYGSLII